MSEELCELGVIGLTAIGQSLAAHHAGACTRVCIGDEDPSFVPQVIAEFKTHMAADEEEGELDTATAAAVTNTQNNEAAGPVRASKCMLPSETFEELVARIKMPRKIIIFGTHGDDVKFEQTWKRLCPLLEQDDVVLRWGKEEEGGDSALQFYSDSIVGNLCKLEAQPKGIHLMEMVRLERDRAATFEGDTPDSFLVGGPQQGYEQLQPYISHCATIGHAGNAAPCAHYAHMIQRAIENGVAQAYAEGHDVMKKAAGFENPDIGRTLKKWGEEEGGRLAGYLLSSSVKIHYKRDHITKKGFVIDHIIDSVDLNSNDTWVTLEATKMGVPAPTVNATLEARFLSVMKDERLEASTVLTVPEMQNTPSVMKDQITDDLQNAIYCACICLIGECMSIFQAASEVESWGVNLKECVRLWKQPGAFLESTLLDKIHSALDEIRPEDMRNLLTVPGIASEMQEIHMSWRRIVSLSFASAIPCPAMSSSLTFYDSYRTRTVPFGLIRAQRDFFDASGYDRFEQEGWFTTCWITPHTRQMKKKESQAASEENGDAEAPKKRRRKKSTDSKHFVGV